MPGDDPQSTQDLTIFVRTFFAACIQSAALARLLVDACARRSRCKICCSKCRAASLPCPTPSSAGVRISAHICRALSCLAIVS